VTDDRRVPADRRVPDPWDASRVTTGTRGGPGQAPTRRVRRLDGSGYDWAYDEPAVTGAPAARPAPGGPRDATPTRTIPRVDAGSAARPVRPGAPSGPDGSRDPDARPGQRARVGPDVHGSAVTTGARPRRRRHPLRAVVVVLLLLVVLLSASAVGLGAWGWSKVGRTAALPSGNRPADTGGTDYLLVGSDSRAGLTPGQKRALGTGSAAGQRTDTILLLHQPSGGGKPVLISIPRDSYLPIPGHGRNKINAAFSIGGPQLLVRTVEAATGVHVDRYVEIGFGGFAGIVDDVGGVQLCLPRALNDPKAHIDLPAGCQVLGGSQALGYVRARYSDPRGDLGRVDHQRQFVAALLKKVISPATLANPVRLRDLARSGGAALTVDEAMSAWQALALARSARAATSAGGVSITVPVSGTALTPAGDSVLWDARLSRALFAAVRTGSPIPSAVIGSAR